jgi:hypothetical protein
MQSVWHQALTWEAFTPSHKRSHKGGLQHLDLRKSRLVGIGPAAPDYFEPPSLLRLMLLVCMRRLLLLVLL